MAIGDGLPEVLGQAEGSSPSPQVVPGEEVAADRDRR